MNCEQFAHPSPVFLAYAGMGMIVLSLTVDLLSRLAGLVGELHAARNELAQNGHLRGAPAVRP